MSATEAEPIQLDDEDDWQVVDPQWWRIHFASVNWSFVAPFKIEKEWRKRKVVRPPFYHDALLVSKVAHEEVAAGGRVDDDGRDEDVNLNPELEGVRSTGGVVRPYESDVGFYFTDDLKMESFEEQVQRPSLKLDVVEPEEAAATLRERWVELVAELTGGLHLQRMLRIRERLDALRRQNSPKPATAGLAASFPSLNNDITAGPSHQSGSAPTVVSPSKPLNVSASEFVPSSPLTKRRGSAAAAARHPSWSSSPLSPPIAHSFPSLDVPPIPDVQIKKDDQGFYTEVTEKGTPRPSSALLPQFLYERKRNRSQTRAFVDSIRSARSEENVLTMKSHTPSPSPAMHDLGASRSRTTVSEDGGDRESVLCASPPVEDDEGWIGVNEATEANTRESKSQRTRDLFLALTRRRTDSLASNSVNRVGPNSTLNVSARKESMDLDRSTSSQSSSPSPKSPYSDGWIDGSSLLQQSSSSSSFGSIDPRSEPRSTASAATGALNATTPTTTSSLPPRLHQHHRNKSSISNSSQVFAFPYTAVAATSPTAAAYSQQYFAAPPAYHSSASTYFYAAAAAAAAGYGHYRSATFPPVYPTGPTANGTTLPSFVPPLPYPLTPQQHQQQYAYGTTGSTQESSLEVSSPPSSAPGSAGSFVLPLSYPYVEPSLTSKATSGVAVAATATAVNGTVQPNSHTGTTPGAAQPTRW